jgi:protein-S-isoprenylcysteine O-methyltransferase Ste14
MKLKIPPPIVALVVIVAMKLAATIPGYEQGLIEIPFHRPVGYLFAAVGILMVIVSNRQFHRASTTVNPMRPQDASTLVTGGLFRYSRNPIYLGMAVLTLAGVAISQNLLNLLFVIAFVVYITLFQIRPEEQALQGRFGAAFDSYCERVRRWI